MATVSIIVKIMPESTSTNLTAIKNEALERMQNEGAKNISFEEKEIAFGLKAIIMQFILDESKGTDLVESKLSLIKEVSSVTIEDYRRTFG